MRGALRLSEAPAQLWDEPALFTQQTAAAALRKKTDQARAKAHCPVRGEASCPCQLGTQGQTTRAGDPGLETRQMCLPNFQAPPQS